MTRSRRLAPTLLATLLPLLLSGCLHDKIAEPMPSVDVVVAIRSADIAPLAVGRFESAPATAAFDRSIAIRGSTMRPPSGSFSNHLRDVLIAQLRAAGRYDAAATTVVSGVLTEHAATEDFNAGHGHMAVTFTVARGGKPVATIPVRADVAWTSSFVGAVAVPNAFNTTSALPDKVLAGLFADSAFRAAARADP